MKRRLSALTLAAVLVLGDIVWGSGCGKMAAVSIPAPVTAVHG